MGKILVLAEKPSVGRELARVLGCRQSHGGSIFGSKYIVTWSLGHLVTLADPEYYGEKYKAWSLEALPMLPQKMELVPIKETAKQFKVVKALLHSNEVDSLVIATDAGREGELVARWIIEKAGFRKPVFRLWISSQTDKAIKDGFNNLKPSRNYDNLYKSAKSRAEADWLVGLNVTRALTCKFNAQLSAGRVQTPTLAMIVDRENEIKRFVPKDYYGIAADLGGFKVMWRDKSNNSRIFDRAKAEAILAKVKNKTAKITEIKKERKSEQAPLLYDLTELQRDANRRYGFSAKQTLGLMQALYEQHKLLTYPRTDSKYLTDDIVPTLSERLKTLPSDYSGHVMNILKKGIRATKRYVDNSKVSDHHAIIPTEQYADISKLTADERRLYDLVVKRFLAMLSPNFEYERITVKAGCEGESFFAGGKHVISKGWKAVYDNNKFVIDEEDGDEEKEQLLPPVNMNDAYKILSVKLNSEKTKPPARYTEATLLSAMEYPGKFIENEKMRGIMDAAGGIGTPATRADIIEKLFSSNYIERRGKDIFPLSKGIQLIELVPSDLKTPELTAKWEQRLTSISKGQESPDDFLVEMKAYASKLVKDVVSGGGAYRHDNITRTRCPECGEFLLEINGKKGKMLACQDRECGYRKNLAYLSNARCPQCHKKLEVLGEGEGRKYFCKCGFREKYDTFNKRLSENRNSVSKRDVASYISNQNKEQANEESALALALKKAFQDKDEK